jgi:hypothetical protein
MHTRFLQIITLILFTSLCIGCQPGLRESNKTTLPEDTATPLMRPTSTSAPAITEQPTPVVDLAKYAFPESVDAQRRYLFYLHGRIIENQGLPAVDPDYGEYEYGAILEKLSEYEFVVISEQRPKDADPLVYAQRIADQATDLLLAGVPPENITIVGASKGAYITILTSDILKNKQIKFVIMAICNPEVIADLKRNQIFLYGNVLSIYDTKDVYASSCSELFSISKGVGLNRYDEIMLEIGTGHGILYKPLKDWIDPVIEWARQP